MSIVKSKFSLLTFLTALRAQQLMSLGFFSIVFFHLIFWIFWPLLIQFDSLSLIWSVIVLMTDQLGLKRPLKPWQDKILASHWLEADQDEFTISHSALSSTCCKLDQPSDCAAYICFVWCPARQTTSGSEPVFNVYQICERGTCCWCRVLGNLSLGDWHTGVWLPWDVEKRKEKKETRRKPRKMNWWLMTTFWFDALNHASIISLMFRKPKRKI